MIKDITMTIEEIHACTLDILKKIISICDDLEINYFLMYGSLLGAVRHKGFIPWDDDLDIAMLASDFDVFCNYCKANTERLLPYKLIDATTSDVYPFNIPRFCDTRYRMESESYDTADMGAFVDVYPLYGVGKQKELNRWFVAKKIIYQTSFTIASGAKVKTRKGFAGYIAKSIWFGIAKVLGRQFFYNKLQKLSQRYTLEESDYVEIVVWDREKIAYEKKWFLKTVLLEFEDILVKVPIGYKELLMQGYGDYMQLPPEEKRTGHHEYRLYRK